MFLLFAMQALTPEAPPLPPPEGGMISASDYPRQALAKHLEGEVRFELIIGTNGRVKTCTINQSSGHLELDEGTCTLLIKRARFKPARDAAHNLVASHYSGRINWRLAQ